MKKFLISIDTEGDNLWNWKKGDPIYTENAKYLDRFQNLCNEYGFKPTYLTNYEMISDKSFASWLKKKSLAGECEVGMHLHAWSTPPEAALSSLHNSPAQPYLIEFDEEIIDKKVEVMTNILSQSTEQNIVTHRSGRWAMDDRYFSALARHGYKYDCSVTPHIDWSAYQGESAGSKGSDYSQKPERPYTISTPAGEILEIPMSIRKTSKVFIDHWGIRSVIGAIKRSTQGQAIWLRPNGKNLKKMLWLIDRVANEPDTDYIMFMLHSSEFMPGGSPTFCSEESIENLYCHLSQIFEKIGERFEGYTVGNYGALK